jgi:hypothetical protein
MKPTPAGIAPHPLPRGLVTLVWYLSVTAMVIYVRVSEEAAGTEPIHRTHIRENPGTIRPCASDTDT